MASTTLTRNTAQTTGLPGAVRSKTMAPTTSGGSPRKTAWNSRPAVVEGQARAQWMHGPDEVGGDVAALDPLGKVCIAEDADRREHRLCQPDVCQRVGGVIAADVIARLEEREQDVRLDEAEDGVRENARPRRRRIRGVTAVAADRQLPVEAHATVCPRGSAVVRDFAGLHEDAFAVADVQLQATVAVDAAAMPLLPSTVTGRPRRKSRGPISTYTSTSPP